jgi:hypothetical protein
MAEFLIYDKNHWMDTLNASEMEEMRQKYSNWDQKYLARYQRGDIVEVRPDGFWTGPTARGFNQEAFRVVSIPGLAVASVGNLTESKTQVADGLLLLKRRYKTSVGAGVKIHTVQNLQKLQLVDKSP